MSTDELMPVQEFERIYATAINLVRSSSLLFDLLEKMKAVDQKLLVEIIRLHNASCDCIKAYDKYKEEN